MKATQRQKDVGPALSAVRTAYKARASDLDGLASVFDQIGWHLDRTLSHPATNKRLRANGQAIVVAIADVRWQRREFVLITEFGVDEIGSLIRNANAFFDSCEAALGRHFEGAELSEAVCALWAQWSRRAYKSFRRGVPAWDASADAAVASLLLAAPTLLSN